MIFQEYLHDQQSLVEETLERLLPKDNGELAVIHEAMRYSCLGGGKRLRAILAIAACEVVGGNAHDALDFAAALEMIHAYSLIHDDLPCMDDDDFRRGKPTNHKVHGEAIAVLAGDALLTEAFRILAGLAAHLKISEQTANQILRETAEACSTRGLIGGQVMDIKSEGQSIDGTRLRRIHQQKTGALFVASVRGGALIGGADRDQLTALTQYAENFGLAFQIADDILDVVGDQVKLGKSVGADRRRDKATYTALYGLDGARQLAEECIGRCRNALQSFQEKGAILEELAAFVVNRDH